MAKRTPVRPATLPAQRGAATGRPSVATLVAGGGDGPAGELPVGRWAPSVRSVLTSLLCVFGVGVSIYLTIAHYAGATLTCPLGGTGGLVDCQKVTTSAESVVFGIPVALLGLAFFLAMLVLCLPVAWRSANRYVAPLRLAASVVSIGFVFYLLHAELFVIHAVCIWCTTVHVLTFIVFVAVVTGWDEAREPYRASLDAA